MRTCVRVWLAQALRSLKDHFPLRHRACLLQHGLFINISIRAPESLEFLREVPKLEIIPGHPASLSKGVGWRQWSQAQGEAGATAAAAAEAHGHHGLSTLCPDGLLGTSNVPSHETQEPYLETVHPIL